MAEPIASAEVDPVAAERGPVDLQLVSLVGAGPGDPGLITVKGLERLRQAEVVVYDRLVDERLLAEAPPSAELVYVGKASSQHTMRQSEINALLVARALGGKRVVRLKGGDPFVFGRGGEEAEELVAAGVPFEVVPGVTSAIAAAAYAGIPVTHRDHTASFAVITGHEDPTKPDSKLDWAKLATGVGTIVCLMGVENLSQIVEQLVRHGRSPRTPVALVRWGTWSTQETLTGTLESITDLVAERQFGPPAVAIVGEVVGLREKLRWFDNRPLFGKRVLVTRTREQASELSRLLAAAGARPIELPTIQIQPPESWSELDLALARLGEYDWIVFTSANGARRSFGRLDALGRDARALGAARVAAIGPGTAEALRAFGIRADFVPGEHVAEALAAGLIERGVAGARVLVPRATEARDALVVSLRAAGADVDEVAAYRTAPSPDSGPRLRELLESGELDVATFASSSAVKSLMSMLGEGGVERLRGVVVACIGPITARTAEASGLRVDVVASEYTIPGLVRALERYYKQ